MFACAGLRIRDSRVDAADRHDIQCQQGVCRTRVVSLCRGVGTLLGPHGELSRDIASDLGGSEAAAARVATKIRSYGSFAIRVQSGLAAFLHGSLWRAARAIRY